MLKYIIFIFFSLYVSKPRAQSFFSTIYDVGGVEEQAMAFVALPLENSIKIIGHRFDTVLPGPNTKPWLGDFGYDGSLNEVLPLIDSQYASPFIVFTSPIVNKENNKYYYYSKRLGSDQWLDPYLIELDVNTGSIHKSLVVINEKHPDYPLNGIFMNYYPERNTIILLNFLEKEDSILTYITLLDTLFQPKKEIEVKENIKKTLGQWCKINQDETITIVGLALIGVTYKIFLKTVDTLGNVLDYKLAPTTVPMNLGLAYTRTIIQDASGNWIISGLYREDKSIMCHGCYQFIPYVFSVTEDFNYLRWETRFFDVPDQVFFQYLLHSMTKVEDGYVVAGDYKTYDGSPFPESGVLFKVSDAGDSLWMKHYIPLNWEEERVAYVNFNDIKTTPEGNLIVAGTVGDFELLIPRPWTLHLDKDGCLVPGCQLVNTHENVSKRNNFMIYPNPVTTELYLLSTISSIDQVNIRVVSNDGSILKQRDFNPKSGYQYILPVDDLVSGVYHLILTNLRTYQTESHTFIRQ